MNTSRNRPLLLRRQHGSNQQLVLRAILAGINGVPAIVEETGLREPEVRTAILRLKDAGRIKPNGRSKGYKPVDDGWKVLQRAWHGVLA